ncbi:AAA family ATPase [Anaeromicropila herbilytica]|uniref:AAA+ ATPase domain-containing protein n=1 Tax=Anaeromicropila herbilytica TaxID=2785025 RepID=A0A7R7ICC8_9FIRM|nr:AAA family ATPase [Anaeromicropila herbilytica]BCN30472.1 hypothetical protein bsdtb5_17670 [Anaeromicropila herbilytica]
MYQTYSNSKLYDIARDNYQKLTRYCVELDLEGYWDNPKVILNQSIQEVLDRYVQAILISLTIYNGHITEDEYSFIQTIPKNNLLLLTNNANVDDDTKKQAMKLVNSPPILLQLCGLRDSEKKLNTASSFFECLLNILLAMTYLNNNNDVFISAYVQEFYRKVSAFVQTDQSKIKKVDDNHRYYSVDFYDDQMLHSVEINDFQSVDKKDVSDQNEDFQQQSRKFKINVPRIEELKKEEEALRLEKENEDNDDKEQELKEQELKEQAIKEQIEEEKRKKNLEALLEELKSLTGLGNVKTEINSLINLLKVRKLRESYNMPIMDMSYHMVFTGNPGTGKTTVARLVAKIYKELGFLSEGTLIETDRAGLVAGFVGQTAIKVKEIVEKAIGGVLFIDEAYTLSSGIGTNDFGSEAIDTLVKLMEDHRDNLVVIVAGYKEEMQEFLKANTGLISRFNKFIEFEDYSTEELMEILTNSAAKNSMILSDEAYEKIKDNLSNMPEERKKTFGNARGIRNVFEKIVVNQANRIVTIESPSINEIERIELLDVMNLPSL